MKNENRLMGMITRDGNILVVIMIGFKQRM